MFEPISQSLYELMMFSILGFFLAVLYEPLRISRLFIKTGAVVVGIQDFLFLSASGLTVFAYSLEFGAGYFRYFYVIGVAFGATVYFLTLGKLISFLMKTFADAIKRALRHVKYRFVLPLFRVIVKFSQKNRDKFVKVYKNVKKCSKDLKNTAQMRYNNINIERRKKRKAREIRAIEKGKQENRNGVQKTAIKARVTKI